MLENMVFNLVFKTLTEVQFQIYYLVKFLELSQTE